VDVQASNAGIINGKIYLTGGWRNTSSMFTIDSTFEYDPAQNHWTRKKACPKKSGLNASCVLDNKLYVFGGFKAFDDATGQQDALVYDPAIDTWDTLKDISYKRGGGATACVYGGLIYVFGGNGNYNGISQTEEKPEKYNPAENNWYTLADMPVPVLYHSSLVHNDRIYIFGGRRTYNGSTTDYIQEYDPINDTWRLMQSMPFKNSSMAVQKAGNFAYFFGGEKNGSETDEVWRLSLDSLPITGIKDVMNEYLSIYPNPTNDLITIKTGIPDRYNIDIINLNGQLMLSRVMGGTDHQLDLSSFQKGIYFITIQSADFVTTRKVIKL
jgi:N-acetylneuraminic acid mutarotase